ncbi:uncharacterized protein METZ01_LOCUS321560, partial [marine metagenome]
VVSETDLPAPLGEVVQRCPKLGSLQISPETSIPRMFLERASVLDNGLIEVLGEFCRPGAVLGARSARGQPYRHNGNGYGG